MTRSLGFVLVSMVVSVGCERTVHVEDRKRACMGVAEMLCMIVDGSNHYGGISGFEYEWSYDYELIVRDVPQAPMADGSSREVELVEVVSKERAPADEPFTVDLTASSFVALEDDGTYSLSGAAFDCTTHATCDLLAAALAVEYPCVGLRLHHHEDDGGPLVLEDVVADGELGCDG